MQAIYNISMIRTELSLDAYEQINRFYSAVSWIRYPIVLVVLNKNKK